MGVSGILYYLDMDEPTNEPEGQVSRKERGEQPTTLNMLISVR